MVGVTTDIAGWGGSYPLEYLSKCFKVTLISLSNTSSPNLKQICMSVFKTLPQVFYIVKVKADSRFLIPLLSLPPPFGHLSLLTCMEQRSFFALLQFKKLN